MLVLTRKLGEKILIGDDIVVTVLDVRGDSIRLGVDAPRGVRIQRDEVVRAVAAANVAATHIDDSAEERLKATLGALSLGALTLTPPPTVNSVAAGPRPGPSASAQTSIE
ncbi:MAG: carbon storage regulator CsrA [Leifsonia sp.]